MKHPRTLDTIYVSCCSQRRIGFKGHMVRLGYNVIEVNYVSFEFKMSDEVEKIKQELWDEYTKERT